MEGGRSQNCLFVVVRLRHQGIRVAGNGSQLCFPGTLTARKNTDCLVHWVGIFRFEHISQLVSGLRRMLLCGNEDRFLLFFFCGGLVRMVLCRFFECFFLWSWERPPSKSPDTRGRKNHLGSTSALWCYSTLQLWQLRLERHGRCQKVVKKHWASWKKLDQWSFPKDQRDLSWFLESHQRVFLTDTVLADFF